MKKKIIYSIGILVFILGAVSGNAQNMVPKKCYLHLIGTINKEYPIEMNLVKINDTIYGDYSFVQPGKIPFGKENTGKGIPVYGKMSSGEAFSLKELIATPGSLFKGKFVNSQALSGTFESSSGSKPLPFEVMEKYPEGSIAMNVYYQKAVMPLVKKPRSPVAAIQLGMLLPGESANPLISDSLIHLMLVKFTGKQVRITQPVKLLDGMKQIYFENYLSTNEGIYNETMASSFNWQSLKFVHILMNGSHILSFYIDHYAFTGGAHGLQTRQFTVVNLWTGKEVGLKDIFIESFEAQLSSILSDKIHEMNHLPTSQSLKEAGFFTDTVKPTDNFYITREGIGFFYNQYDIAPYASGSIDVFIPFRELKDVLVAGGVIRELSR
ncbi:MAG TPA: DUF3298 domain-containing protein [Bacteroidales bacterium]|nr:DUF3298 domain-containing protein [Bacteroidales bacterium]